MQIKPKILTRFLVRKFLASFFLVLAVVAGIIFIITFVEKLPGEASAMSALYLSFALLLSYIPLLLPLVMFIGTLLTSYGLTRSNESVIIASAGLSPYQSMRSFLVVSVLIGIFVTAVVNPIAVKLNSYDIGTSQMDLVDGAVWLRETNNGSTFTMRATGLKRVSDALSFSNVIAFVQDVDSKFKYRVQAKEITLSGGTLSAKNATVTDTSGIPRSTPKWNIGTLMTPDTVLERNLRPDQVSFWKLPKFIDALSAMKLNTREHYIQFWTLLFLPLTLVAMVVLGIAFAQTHERRNFSFGIKFSIGILASFILYFVINVFGALGTSGSLPTILAVLAPPLIVLAGAAIAIVSFDTI
ncbi:MAG: LptF/LptG family permease [Proteobacteria bacterium]|nr:LptF/LptG family permease [Pseudomonadota bacterium]